MVSRRIDLAGSLLALTLLALHVPLTLAAPVAAKSSQAFKPTLELSEHYSDNIALSSGERTSSVLTEIRPGFTYSTQGGHGSLNVNYSLQALLYSHDSDANTNNNQLSASLNTHWLDKRLTLDADARLGQQNTRATSAIGSGNYNLTGNRSDVRSFGLTPAWRSKLGDSANFEARWRFSYVDTDAKDSPDLSAVSGATSNTLNLALNSGSAFNQVPWSLAYQVRETDASNRDGNRDSSITGSVGYNVSRKTHLKLTAGRDFNDGDSAAFNRVSGGFWTLGVDWSPSVRTHLGASAGRRFGGDTYGLDFTHRTRKSSWMLSYAESIADTYQQINGIDVYLCEGSVIYLAPSGVTPDSSICRNPLLIAILTPDDLFIEQTAISKTWSGVTSYKTGKSVFSLSYRQSQRDSLASLDGARNDTNNLTGSWSMRLSPRLNSTLSLTSTHAENTSDESDDWSLGWRLTYQLTRLANSSLELKRAERTSDSSTGPYSENSLTARLNMSF